MGEVTNFARFYQAFNRMPYSGDREELKKQIVLQYTWNRTDSLREMSMKEYLECCAGLEKLIGKEPEAAQREGNMTRAERETLRANRSQALHWMQKLGIDTADWDCVNSFCKNPRIAGKPFREITTLELVKLVNKLRAIDRKGGLRTVEEKRREGMTVRYNITAPCGEA